MIYRLVYTRRAERDIKKLEPKTNRPRHLTPIFLKSQFPWQKWPFNPPKRPLFYTFFFHFRCLAWSDPAPLSPNVFKIDQQRMMKYNQIMGVHEEIRSKILRRLYEFSKHAVDQSIIRDISVAEMEEAITGGSEVVEDYPDDKYGPSCLILGFTKAGRALHMQCSYPSRPLIKIVTLYEPDPDLWVDFRIRKQDQ